VIEINNIKKNFGKIQAVRGISFSVPEGKILGLLGPNGAGKTTTMRILTCFMPPTSGNASVAGYDILENPVEIRRALGYMPENPPIYPEMEVTAFLRFVAAIKDVPKNEISKAVETAMKRVNITHIRGRVIGHLSRGYRQRVGLAQALVHQPKVLILDEPTLGLDPNQIIEIRELIRSLAGKHSIIISSHILPEVQATCEHVAIINQGKIVAKDTMQNLTKGQKLLISLKGNGNIKQSIKKILATLKYVSQVNERPGGRDKLSFELLCDSESDKTHDSFADELGENVYKVAVENKWVLLEINPVRTSLEEIFLRTTSGEDQREPSKNATHAKKINGHSKTLEISE